MSFYIPPKCAKTREPVDECCVSQWTSIIHTRPYTPRQPIHNMGAQDLELVLTGIEKGVTIVENMTILQGIALSLEKRET